MDRVKRVAHIGVPILLVLLWLLLVRPPIALDYGVYRLGASAIYGLNGLDANLYGSTLGYPGAPGLPFTYPPFAALLFLPIGLLPASLGFVILTACTVLIAYWFANTLASLIQFSKSALAVGKAHVSMIGLWGGLAILSSGPWRDTIDFGQINALLLFMCLWDLTALSRGRDNWRHWSGFLVGVAAGIKLTPLVFGFYFLMRRDFASLMRMLGGFALTVLVAWIAVPNLASDYWLRVIVDPARIGNLDYADNTSLRGTLLHLSIPQDLAVPVWLGASTLLAVIAGICIVLSRGQGPIIGTAATALLMLLASPVTWSHHWVWLPLIGLGTYAIVRGFDVGLLLRVGIITSSAIMVLAFWISPKWIAIMSGSDADGEMSSPSMILVSVGSIAAFVVCLLWACALLRSRSAVPRKNTGRKASVLHPISSRR